MSTALKSMVQVPQLDQANVHLVFFLLKNNPSIKDTSKCAISCWISVRVTATLGRIERRWAEAILRNIRLFVVLACCVQRKLSPETGGAKALPGERRHRANTTRTPRV
jgi:hypothetical protein